jgi:3-dehydroquinate dehydratase-2
MKIAIINGPNLNMLGTRKPEVYGSKTLKDLESDLLECSKELDVELLFFQSNIEGEIINFIHSLKEKQVGGIVINPAAYTHTSIAIRDAIEAVEISTIEVHISNVHKRDEFRHKSYISAVAKGQIVGLGFKGYELAIRALI